jgi:hypothetical protein
MMLAAIIPWLPEPPVGVQKLQGVVTGHVAGWPLRPSPARHVAQSVRRFEPSCGSNLAWRRIAIWLNYQAWNTDVYPGRERRRVDPTPFGVAPGRHRTHVRAWP